MYLICVLCIVLGKNNSMNEYTRLAVISLQLSQSLGRSVEATTASTMEHVRMMCVSVRNPMEVHTALLVSDVCVCVCVYVCVCVCVVCVCVFCVCVCVCVCTYVCVCVCVCVCVYVYVGVCVGVWVCMLVGVGLLMIMCSCVYVDLSTFGRTQGAFLFVCTVYCSMGGAVYSSTHWGMRNSAGLAGFL